MDRASKDKATKQMQKQLQLRAERMQLEKMQTQLQLEEWQLYADETEALVEMQLRDERMQLEEMELRDERMQLEIMQLRDEKLQLKMENDILLKKLSQYENLIRSLRHDNRELELRGAILESASAPNVVVVKPCFTDTTWTCKMCTIINPHTSRSCQMCNSMKMLINPKSVLSQASCDDDGKYDT
jgi:chromosome segregation ATPase